LDLTAVQDVLQSISAKSDGEACCQWVGDEGAGHYVKMVHNGIEYGDMQLICEVRSIVRVSSDKLTVCRPTIS
jgi:6-phosphogluconate dehydrogenase